MNTVNNDDVQCIDIDEEEEDLVIVMESDGSGGSNHDSNDGENDHGDTDDDNDENNRGGHNSNDINDNNNDDNNDDNDNDDNDNNDNSNDNNSNSSNSNSNNSNNDSNNDSNEHSHDHDDVTRTNCEGRKRERDNKQASYQANGDDTEGVNDVVGDVIDDHIKTMSIRTQQLLTQAAKVITVIEENQNETLDVDIESRQQQQSMLQQEVAKKETETEAETEAETRTRANKDQVGEGEDVKKIKDIQQSGAGTCSHQDGKQGQGDQTIECVHRNRDYALSRSLLKCKLRAMNNYTLSRPTRLRHTHDAQHAQSLQPTQKLHSRSPPNGVDRDETNKSSSSPSSSSLLASILNDSSSESASASILSKATSLTASLTSSSSSSSSSSVLKKMMSLTHQQVKKNKLLIHDMYASILPYEDRVNTLCIAAPTAKSNAPGVSTVSNSMAAKEVGAAAEYDGLERKNRHG